MGVFVSPKAPVRSVAVRWVVEVAVFGSAASALWALDRASLAVLLVAAYATNRLLMAIWGQGGQLD